MEMKGVEPLSITKFVAESRLKPKSSEQSAEYHIKVFSGLPCWTHQKLPGRVHNLPSYTFLSKCHQPFCEYGYLWQ